MVIKIKLPITQSSTRLIEDYLTDHLHLKKSVLHTAFTLSQATHLLGKSPFTFTDNSIMIIDINGRIYIPKDPVLKHIGCKMQRLLKRELERNP
jgi:hypothetical protein